MEENIIRFKKSYFKMTKIYSEIASYFNITSFQLRLLTLIRINGEKTTQKYLIESSGCSKQTINSAISTFVEKGYAKLEINPSSHREKFVVLTDEGRVVVNNIFNTVEIMENASLKAFSTKEIESFLNFFEKYTSILEDKISEELE